MDRLEYDFFFKVLKENGTWLDETHFYFSDDPEEEEHWLGCILSYEQPYWAGGCDIPRGCDFDTAEELLNAPIYNGKSLRERWADVRIIGMMGLGLEDWYELYRERGTGKSPRGEPQPL